MTKYKAIGKHPSGKYLRAGDEVMCYGQKGEFVGVYGSIPIIYFKSGECIQDVAWNHILVKDPPDEKAKHEQMAGRLF